MAAMKPKKQMPANKGETGGGMGARIGAAATAGAIVGLAKDKKKAAPKKPAVKPKAPTKPAKPAPKPKKTYKDAASTPGFKFGKGTE